MVSPEAAAAASAELLAKEEEERKKREVLDRAEAALTGRWDQIDGDDAEDDGGKQESSDGEKKESREDLKRFFDQKNKSVTPAQPDFTAARQLTQVAAVPLKPSYIAGQPYRVAKPTAMSQGIGRKRRRGAPEDDKPRRPRAREEEQVKVPVEVLVTGPMTVRELAQTINVSETQVITYFFMRKIIKTVNDMLEKDLVVKYLTENKYVVITEGKNILEHEHLMETLIEDEEAGDLIRRPPVVTIMGHVDHGKTTLLDSIRAVKQKVVDTESGGITQHIRAYGITTKDYDGNDRRITFIDTPGHEAFSAMRKRGAYITDIVVLIVAADDGIKPQTVESIKHIKEAKVPFLVAVNKVDKPDANIDKALGQLAEHGIIVEQYGGKTVCSMISALKKENLDDLLEKILLVADAELEDVIRSNPNRPAIGTVIEAELSRSKGPLATMLVQNGTLKRGDYIAAGAVNGRVKALYDENNNLLEGAGPSTPVKVLGFSGVPKAGDQFKVYASSQEAKQVSDDIADKELEKKRYAGLASYVSEVIEGQAKELRVIIKADVQGSAEAIANEVCKFSTEEVLVQPIAVESGSITSNDIALADRTGAVIIGFHVGMDVSTAKLADKLKVKVKSYEIIYKITEDIERAALGMHEPDREEVKLGEIEVRKLFTINNRSVAGSYVRSGKIVRGEIARVSRDGVQLYEGRVDYLKRFKDDAKEVKEGFECGLSFEKYNDLQEGDIIQCWTVREVVRTRL
jgi:translation initiation factor IF-2